jgi:acetyl esterase/lipase
MSAKSKLGVLQRLPICLLAASALYCLSLSAQEPKKKQLDKLPADEANVAYGTHRRHVLDLWRAKSDKPTPLLVFIHGGGFRGGSKENLPPQLLDGCLKEGISVASINYRLSPEVAFPAHYMDSARAIQFLRHKAKEWNLDPQRVAASGGSAGAGTSLWLAFHEDLADPKSDDPVLRQSTRLTCAAVFGAQSTYDPRVIKEWVGGRAHEHPALPGFYGLKTEELDSEKAHKLYEAASPITHLTKDDPPVFAFYSEPKGPLPADARPGQGIHHLNFGLKLKERMDALKIECVVRHLEDYKASGGNMNRETIEFLAKHLKAR